MTRGLAQDLVSNEGREAVAQQQRRPDKGKSGTTGSGGIESAPPPHPKVIAVVCSGNLAAYRDEIKANLAQGIEQRPDAVWVCIESKSDRITHGVFESLDVEPVVLPLNPWWKGHLYDNRRVIRDCELMRLCDEVVVFLERKGKSVWRERYERVYSESVPIKQHENLYLIELGKKGKAA